jgi:hypothetical protein
MHTPQPSRVSISSRARRSPNQRFLTAAVLAALAVPAAAQLQFQELPRRGWPANNLVSSNCGAFGDVDGDGDLDLIFGCAFGQNRLARNDGSGAFSDVTATYMPIDNDTTNSVAFGDVDGDGDLDLICGNMPWYTLDPYGHPVLQANGRNRLYLNNGSGTFTMAPATQLPAAAEWTTAVALGDVDGDGDLDLVLGNLFQPNRLYVNNGHGTFTDVTAARLPGGSLSTTTLALGDVDGDGDLDLVVGSHSTSTALYLNDGLGTFAVAAGHMPFDASHYVESVALGDVDGDGDLDLVLGTVTVYYRAGQTRLYLNDGSGTFVNATATNMPVDSDHTYSVALGDIDGDGDLDLVLGNRQLPGQNCLYRNNGSGVFTDATAARMPIDTDFTSVVALGDADGDGDLDLAVGNRGQNHVYFNLQHQLDAPLPLRTGQTYTLDAYARYGPIGLVDLALPYVSLAPASIPLAPFGTIGIDPAQMVALPPVLIPQPAGVGSVSLAVPNQPGLLGLSVYSQALLVPYPYAPRLSNVMHDVIVQ